MTEKILPYDRGIVPQETGYWCGPASTQILLNSRGIIVPERELADDIGTTVNGTDFVGLIENVLDRRVPDANYTSVYMPNDPPTEDERTRLWWDIVHSIDAGWPVIFNFVAPPSNYPRGVKGSSSPAYGGGTVYHYTCGAGWSDEGGEQAVWIADPGFRPFGYWVSFAQLATLIPPKGYAFANLINTPPAPVPLPPPVPAGPDPAEVLAGAMGGSLSLDRYRQLLPAFSRALGMIDANSVERIAMFCAQVGHESSGLRYMQELGDDAYFAQYNGRGDLGNTQPGDGPRFHGRGPLQVTGRHNYTVLSEWAFAQGYVDSPSFFVDNPDALAGDELGFIGAVWYWTTQRPLNEAADQRNIVWATELVNGGHNGLDDRIERWNHCLGMGVDLFAIGRNDAMDAEARQWLREVRDKVCAYPDVPELAGKWPSRARCRRSNDGVDDTVGMELFTDANTYDHLIAWSAVELGDPFAVETIRAGAAGELPANDEASVAWFRAVAAKLPVKA